MAKTRNKPSHYPALPFHAIRFSSLLSASIVSGILIYFCYQLKHDGFKLPWTFLIVLAASLTNLILLLLTFLIHCCGTLSPLFNLIVNIPLLVFWLLGLCLLCYNIYGALGHSCSISNWASKEGVMICQGYKALFSFTVIGTISQVAQVILDVKARRTQTSLGVYGKMEEPVDLKMEVFPAARDPGAHELPYTTPHVGEEQYRDNTPGWRPGTRSTGSHDHMDDFQSVRMEHFGYEAPVQQTTYDSGYYHDQADHRRRH